MKRIDGYEGQFDFARGPRWGRRSPSTAALPHSAEEGEAPAAPVRWELIRRVRREIARGEYETPQRWGVALERLLGELESA